MSTMAEESTSIYLIQSVVSSPVNSEPCQFKYSYKISPFTISPVLERKASYVKIATRFIKACCNFKADSGQAPVWGFIRVVTSDCYESLTYLSIFSTLLLTKGVYCLCFMSRELPSCSTTHARDSSQPFHHASLSRRTGALFVAKATHFTTSCYFLRIEGWVRCYASSFKCFRTSKYCEEKMSALINSTQAIEL